jgi:hypothetical protein
MTPAACNRPSCAQPVRGVGPCGEAPRGDKESFTLFKKGAGSVEARLPFVSEVFRFETFLA